MHAASSEKRGQPNRRPTLPPCDGPMLDILRLSLLERPAEAATGSSKSSRQKLSAAPTPGQTLRNHSKLTQEAPPVDFGQHRHASVGEVRQYMRRLNLAKFGPRPLPRAWSHVATCR